MSTAVNILVAASSVAAFALAAVAVRGWLHARNPKIAWVAGGFGLLAAKAMVLSIALFAAIGFSEVVLVPSLALDVAALACFYFAILHRSP